MIKDYVSLDLETTGLDAKKDKILEIGAVKVENFEIVENFEMLIRPPVTISDRITEVTGITNEMVENSPYINDILPEFIDFCEDYVIIGHNLMFDYSFIKRNAVNLNLEFNHKGIDTLRIARKYLADLEKRNLDYLCKYYGIEDNNHHRAFNDATVTHRLYKLMCEADYFSEEADVFRPCELVYKVKKEQPATIRQINYLNDLLKYHRIKTDVDIFRLSKNEASRYIDKIISRYGKITNKF